MRWFLVFSLLFLANCANQTTALVSVNSANQNVSTNQLADNTNTYSERLRINEEKVKKLEIQNERFKVVPEEFKNVDFKNFTYPTDYPYKSVTLKNGEFEYELRKYNGGGWFNLSNVYFVDLTGDDIKEAIVFLGRVDCGASCDGGSDLVYVYSPRQKKSHLIWQFEFGSGKYECSLKSFTIKEKKMFFDAYDDCIEKNQVLEVKEGYLDSGRSSSFGFTEFIYKFDGKKFVREKMQYTQPENIDHLNHLAEISINE